MSVYGDIKLMWSDIDVDVCWLQEVMAFRDALRSSEESNSGQIHVEFYQKKRARWLLPTECIPWEVKHKIRPKKIKQIIKKS